MTVDQIEKSRIVDIDQQEKTVVDVDQIEMIKMVDVDQLKSGGWSRSTSRKEQWLTAFFMTNSISIIW